jgi:hypothetical protein
MENNTRMLGDVTACLESRRVSHVEKQEIDTGKEEMVQGWDLANCM